MIKFFQRTRAQYNEAYETTEHPEGSGWIQKDSQNTGIWAEGIYFITDDQVLMLGGKEYGRDQLVYVGDTWTTPSTPKEGVLYVSKDGTQKIYQNTQYVTVQEAHATSITSETVTAGAIPTAGAVSGFVDGKISTLESKVDANKNALAERIKTAMPDANTDALSGLLTAGAIRDFIANENASVLDKAVTAVSFSGSTLSVKTDVDGTPVETIISGLIDSATYEAGQLKISASGGKEVTVDIPAEQFLNSISYCKVTAGMKDGSEEFKVDGTNVVPSSFFASINEGSEGIIFQLAKNIDSDADIEEYAYSFVSYANLIKAYTAPTKANTTPIQVAINSATREITATLSTDSTLTVTDDGKLSVVGDNVTIPSGNVTGLSDQINAINSQLNGTGGSGSDGSLVSRVGTLEDVTNYDVLSGANNSLLENIGTADDPDYRLRAKYNPGVTLQMKGTEVEKNATTINFIGNCMVVTDGNGNVVTRIGDNLNSSNFNTTDGQTTGTASLSRTNTGSATPATDYDGESTTYTKTGSASVSTTGLIHFDNATSTYFNLEVFVGRDEDKTTIRIPSADATPSGITGNGTYTSEVDGVSLTITNWGTEAKSAEGATGYQGKPTINITNAALLSLTSSANKDIAFKVTHVNGSEGSKTFGPSAKTYIIADTSTTPTVATASCGFGTQSTKKCSGIEYITGGSVEVEATGITGLAVPAYVSEKVVISTVGGNWFTPPTQSGENGLAGFSGNSDDTVNYSGTSTTLKTGYFTGAGVSVQGQNVNGKGTAVSSSTSTYNIDAGTYTAATAIKDCFKDESQRLPATVTGTWDNTASISGSIDLMVTCGKLRYPSSTMFGQTFDQTSERVYVRKFTKSGSMPGGTIIVGSSADISTVVAAGNLKIQVSKDGTNWYNICFKRTETISGDVIGNIGKSNSTWGTTNSLVYVFSDGAATDEVYIRIKMTKDCSITISSIELA